MPEIIVKIPKKNPTKIEVEVDGARGQGCTAMLDAFQKATRLKTQSQRLKPEYRDEVKQRLPQGRR